MADAIVLAVVIAALSAIALYGVVYGRDAVEDARHDRDAEVRLRRELARHDDDGGDPWLMKCGTCGAAYDDGTALIDHWVAIHRGRPADDEHAQVIPLDPYRDRRRGSDRHPSRRVRS